MIEVPGSGSGVTAVRVEPLAARCGKPPCVDRMKNPMKLLQQKPVLDAVTSK